MPKRRSKVESAEKEVIPVKSPYFDPQQNVRAGYDFFNVDTVTLAKRLLGQALVSKFTSERTAGIIVETEAYPGGPDEASHSFGGKRTTRNEALYQPSGTFYVYYCYGRLSLCNVSSNEPGAGVLIRALEPIEGVATMYKNRGINTPTMTSKEVKVKGEVEDTKKLRNLCNGPAKLSQAMGITRDNANMLSLVDADKIFLELMPAKSVNFEVHETTRIGIDYAGEEWKKKLWRYYIKGSNFISRK